MFYHIHDEPGDFICYKYDINETRGNIYTEKEIQTMRSEKDIETEQEYLCKFTTAQGSNFGTGTDAEKTGLRDMMSDEEEEENENEEIPLNDSTEERILENENYRR